jgi:alpha-L-fucosidase 2
MKSVHRRSFLKSSFSAALITSVPRPLTAENLAQQNPGPTEGVVRSLSTISPWERAARHSLDCKKPAVNFFEGALLGNGGLGAVVTTRPDGVAIHLGHNNVWDIRVAENHQEEIGTFQPLFERIKQIPDTLRTLEEDPWYQAYVNMTAENYSKPYPRPFPCGTLLLGFERLRTELIGHHLDISTGICRVEMVVQGKPVFAEIFTEMDHDRLWLRTTNSEGQSAPSPFERIHLIPDSETPKEFPPFSVRVDEGKSLLQFTQLLPFNEPQKQPRGKRDPRDRAFRISVKTSSRLTRQSRLNWSGVREEMGDLERGLNAGEPLLVVLELEEGLASSLRPAENGLLDVTGPAHEKAGRSRKVVWQAYWERSGVALEDEFLESLWYRNLYFLNCATRPGVNCPGLFANWTYRNIGTAWHGDYHMNYNTQQPFWVCFSSNHLENHLPYVNLVDHLLPISRKWARDYYGLSGAYFPHSAYPVEMNLMPYPVPTWGWEICETPWTVQSLWWHYLYSMDIEFLKQRAFGPIKEAVLFLVDYMRRPEAHGSQWGDDKFHVFPTVPPELYGLTPGFRMNRDCLVDLTLIKFVFKAYLSACDVLKRASAEGELPQAVQQILTHFPDYPTAESPSGQVFVSVPGEQAGTVYNVPNSVMTVFPGEDHGLHSPREQFQVAANSYRQHRNEGGNDLVFLNLQGARLGLLDLERFKRQVQYCLLPNGTCADMVMQVHGRYSDTTPYDFMAPMAVWFENFALPVVINECLFQSYNGTMRFFPNWPVGKKAEFRSLRAAGAFLVSASFDGRYTQWIEIKCEVGGPLKVLLPWKTGAICRRKGKIEPVTEPHLETDTSKGELLQLKPKL